MIPFALADTGVDPDHMAEHGVNALRVLGGHTVVWGARTAAWQDPDWKYVTVRRTVAVLELSMERGLQWTASEPNGEALWAQVRAGVADFLHGWWRHGALAGEKPSEAYFVRCDRTTMSESDLAEGRLVVLVGVALLRPKMFLVLPVVLQTTPGT
jgi:phage tail sheath protein FI